MRRREAARAHRMRHEVEAERDEARAERDEWRMNCEAIAKLERRYREALEYLRDHYEPSVGANYVCAGMAEYVYEVTDRALLNGEDE